jgi:hypothetical protein
LLIDHVVVGKDEIVIKHIVPTDDDCRLLPGHRFIQIKGKKSSLVQFSVSLAEHPLGLDTAGKERPLTRPAFWSSA